MRSWVWLAWLFAALAGGAAAQGVQPASLIADRVDFDRGTEVLTATGNVEVLYEGRVLRAARISYDARADAIRAVGPLVLTDPAGGVLLADAADLSPDLTEGLIEGARLLIADQLQIAAAEVRQTGGRFTTLERTVASSCTICPGNPTPTWAIRADRVIRDSLVRRIYFDNATVEVFGLPVGYLPRLSIPEPGVERASGVLVPTLARSQIYGFGLKVPYYQVLGPHADATITPFVTSEGTAILEGDYRRRTARGGYDISGVFALDDGLGGTSPRGAFAATGAFALGRGFIAEFDLDTVSDDDFLQQFDYSDADRLTTTARIRRTRAKDHFELGAIAFQSLRASERTGQIPVLLPEFTYRRLLEPRWAGGRVGIDLDALGIFRDSGRDVLRLGGGADWRRDWTLSSGVLATATAGAIIGVYRSWDDQELPAKVRARAVPSVGVELRWPLARSTGAVEHVIEPIVQVFYSDARGDIDVPNEDSRLPELDQTNLFSLDRFPGRDRQETGMRANLGVNYLRHDPAGWTLGATLGQVVRTRAVADFAEGTDLGGRWSDYVAAVSFDFDWGLSVVERALFDPEEGFRRNEFALTYTGERGSLDAAYVYLAPDATNRLLGPQPETSELALDGSFRFRPNWEVSGNWRYDLSLHEDVRAGGTITYGNECAEIDLSVSRRYTSSANVPPSTSVGFSVRLAGLGASRTRDFPARVCGG